MVWLGLVFGFWFLVFGLAVVSLCYIYSRVYIWSEFEIMREIEWTRIIYTYIWKMILDEKFPPHKIANIKKNEYCIYTPRRLLVLNISASFIEKFLFYYLLLWFYLIKVVIVLYLTDYCFKSCKFWVFLLLFLFIITWWISILETGLVNNNKKSRVHARDHLLKYLRPRSFLVRAQNEMMNFYERRKIFS